MGSASSGSFGERKVELAFRPTSAVLGGAAEAGIVAACKAAMTAAVLEAERHLKEMHKTEARLVELTSRRHELSREALAAVATARRAAAARAAASGGAAPTDDFVRWHERLGAAEESLVASRKLSPLGTAPSHRRQTIADQIVDLLGADPGTSKAPKEIAEELDALAPSVRAALARLLVDGRVHVAGEGRNRRYTIAE